MRNFWTAERVETLKRLWAEGRTATAIAANLGGSSRSGVLGKLYRLRLALPEAGAPAAAVAKSERPGRRRPGRAPAPKPQLAAAPQTRGKSLLDLTNECCRWPHGEPGTARFHFCGAPGADLQRGMPYCERHMQRAYPMIRETTERLLGAKPMRSSRPRAAPLPSIVPARPQWIVASLRGGFDDDGRQ